MDEQEKTKNMFIKMMEGLVGFVKEKDKKKYIKKLGDSRLFVVFLAGVLLLVIALPDGFLAGGESSFLQSDTKSGKSGYTKSKEKKEESVNSDSEQTQYAQEMEKKLEELLEQVEGVGEVKVMVTLAASTEEVTLKDTPYTKDTVNETDARGGSRSSVSVSQEENSILVEDEQGRNVPYVTKTIEPKIEGIVVLAQGADTAEVKNEIIEAVEVLFSVATHKIKVMKLR